MPFTPIPDEDIIMPNTPPVVWQDIVEALARLAKLVTPNTRIHSFWNIQPTIGASLQLMRSEADGGRVNGLLLGINAAVPTPAEQQKVGGSGMGCQFDWDLSIDWWRFLGYEKGTKDANVFITMFNDCRNYTVIIQRNQLTLGMMGQTMLKKVGMLKYESIDLHGFPEGDAIIAQGNIIITLREQL